MRCLRRGMKDIQRPRKSWQGDGEEHSVEGYAVRLSYEHADVLLDVFEYLQRFAVKLHGNTESTLAFAQKVSQNRSMYRYRG